MNDALKSELENLRNLQGQGTLEESQLARLSILETVEKVEKTAAEKSKDLESALAQKDHFRSKFEKEEADRKALEIKLNQSANNTSGTLAVEDYIDISASLEGLDQKEKEKLAKEHKLTQKPLSEIRKDEDFLLWQKAYREKVEKEKTLKPSGTQSIDDQPKSFMDKLRGASLADKEKMLSEAGLYKTPRPRADRTNIGLK